MTEPTFASTSAGRPGQVAPDAHGHGPPQDLPGPTTGWVGLAAVSVGMPAHLGTHRGHPVTSGMAKAAVAPDRTLALGPENLEGDGQADLSVHGGPNKAVYAYPFEHLALWSAELSQDLGPAAFGENLTTLGWLESDVCIGDQWSWGGAILEVSQPRSPCFKLGIHRGSGRVITRLRETGRTGWYLRVLSPGPVPAAGPIRLVHRHPMGATVALMHQAASPTVEVPVPVLDALLAVEPLAEEWRIKLAARRWPDGADPTGTSDGIE
ncbi:MAG: MOSC domain-containing protein [Acidimicrobiales bacterium]